MSLDERAAVHRALSDPGRLRLVDSLIDTDRTPGDLAAVTGMNSNLVAFHLGVLESAGVVERHRSEGDSRRRYVHLLRNAVAIAAPRGRRLAARRVLFVCTRNSARSQFAEARWRQRTGGEAWSAGTEPATRVPADAVAAAARYGVDLGPSEPKGLAAVPADVDLVVSVCDRALETGAPAALTVLHWSVADPALGDRAAFDRAFAEIASRINGLQDRVA